MAHSLDCIFKPQSVAVVGASNKKGTIGYVILHNLIRYEYNWQLFAVNPKASVIHSMKCYASVLDIPDRIDLAVVVVHRDLVKETLEQCGQKGVKGVIVITSGFKEIGREGADKEVELLEVVRRYGMRMVGPNCYGVINTDPEYSMNTTFSKALPPRGKVAFLSQSGALGEAVLDYTSKLNMGFSMFMSVGNKADISDCDVLDYWRDDPRTEVILLYLENLENCQEFARLAKEITRRKPIVAIKTGRTDAGARAISSHTGVLAGGDVGADAVFAQCGILRAGAIDEVFDIATAFSNQPLPRGDRVAVITNAGGPGILATDAVVACGMTMAVFEPKTIEFLKANLSPMAAVSNPIDVIASGGPDAYGAAVDAVLSDNNVDALIVIFVPPILVDHRAIINAIIEKIAKHRNSKTVLGCLMGAPQGIEGSDEFGRHQIPIFTFPESAAKALSAMVRYRQWLQRPEGKIVKFNVNRERVKGIIDRAVLAGQKVILGSDGLAILEAYGIGIPRSARAGSEAELEEALKKLRLPLAMKVDDVEVIHKTDMGGVALNLSSRDEVSAAFNKMKELFSAPEGEFAGVLIQEMVKDGVETIIGMNRDPIYGPLMMFGLGGISVEIMKDVAFKVQPLTDSDAEEMIKSIKGYKLLSGFRGAPPADLRALEETILRLSQLVTDFPYFESFDVNPFFAAPDRTASMAVDARFVLKN